MGHWKARLGKEQMVYNVTREFELLNQDIKVNMQFPQEIYKSDNYSPRLADSAVKMIQTNNYTWDILFLDPSNYDNIANKLKDREWGKKYLVNFEEFDWFKAAHKPFVFEDPQYREATAGIMVGPLIEGIYSALWYNQKVTERIGITIKPENMTFEDFKGYLKAAFEYNQNATQKITLINTEMQNNIKLLFANLVISEIGDADLESIDRNTAYKAFFKALKAFEELSVYKPLEKIHSQASKDITLLDEKNLFTVIQTYSYNRWAKIDMEKTRNLVPVELPVMEQPVKYYPGSYQAVWCVFKNSPNRDNAIKAMKYLCTNDISQQWLALTKNPTALKSRINTSDLTQDKIDRFITEVDRKYGRNVKNVNINAVIFGKENAGIYLNPDAVLKGEITAEEFYRNIMKNVR